MIFKKYIIVSMTMFLLLTTNKASSTTCTDPMSVYNQIYDQVAEGLQWAEEKTQILAQNELYAELQNRLMKKMTENSSNQIARMTDQMKDVYNKQVENMLKSVGTSCEIVEDSDKTKETRDSMNEKITEKSEEFISKRLTHKTQAKHNDDRKTELKENVDKFIALGGGSDSPNALRADVLLGSKGATFTQEDDEAAGHFIKNLTGEVFKKNPPPVPTATSTSGENARYSVYLRDTARDSVIHASFNAIKAERSPVVQIGEGVYLSHLGVIDRFVKGKWGGSDASEFISIVTNSHPDKKSNPDDLMTSEAQVLRIIATMDAFELYLNHRMYEQSLRMETQMATQTQILADMARR